MIVPTMKVLQDGNDVVINKDDFDPAVHVLYEESVEKKAPKKAAKKTGKKTAPKSAKTTAKDAKKVTGDITDPPVTENAGEGDSGDETPWEKLCSFAKDGQNVAVAMKAAVDEHGLSHEGETLDKVALVVNAPDVETLRIIAKNFGVTIHHSVSNLDTARQKLFESLKE